MRIVIAGGGVAGSACAVALAHFGHDVTAYEAYEDPAGPVGSFLSLAANGLRGLAVLGCLPAVQKAGIPVERQRMWSGGGKLLGDVPRGRRGTDPLLSVTLMRSELVSVLRDAAVRSGARFVTGTRLTASDLRDVAASGPQTTDSVVAGADLVVGADGIWSAARSAIDPAAREPAYAGLYSVSGTSAGLDLDPGSWNFIFARHGAFIWLQGPDQTTWWSAQVSGPAPADLSAVGPDALSDRFRSEPAAVRILGATTARHGATLHHVLAPVRRRHDDRIVLVGDAAHPVGAGQGASMAIEDAIALARQLQAGSSVPAALAGFDQVRRARVGKMAKSAAANRDAKTAGPVAARLREMVMPLVFNRVYERATGWLYDYDPGTLTEPVTANRA
jgi:2-polyprenyl-6-methoxyphenol hydroxylase-like FAD-dependent oxidoreductase